jgi:hypothetical protein
MGCGNSVAVPSLPDSGHQSRMSQHSRAGGDCLIARVRFSGRHEIRSRLGDQKCTAPCAESTYMKSTNPKFRIHDLASTQIFSRLFLPFPQGSPIVHRIRTAPSRFFVDARIEMRESSITASVKVALPVIVKVVLQQANGNQLPARPKGFAGERTQ